jgi:hypothetical protein
MWRTTLTLWFTITTLLGPGVCCCSFASAKPTTADGRSSITPAKSCCDQNAPPCCPDGKHREPGKPSKCPCEKGKQATTLPPTAASASDLSAQLKSVDALLVGLVPSFAFTLSGVGSHSADTTQRPVHLSGRDLLAVYSLLRC